ncbi:MAG TPA: hypothetical protein VGK73_10235 [Polyangiaceae bacterium]
MTSAPFSIPSSLHGNFQIFAVVACALLAAACGSDEDDGVCPNPDTPAVLEVIDLVPELEASVTGEVSHSFTVVNATGSFTSLSFTYTEAHGAGSPSPAAFSFEGTPSGANMVYDFEPVTWGNAGRVELVETGEYTDMNGCFVLPRPLFAYEYTP